MTQVIMFELLAGCSPFLTGEQARSLKKGSSTVSFTVKHVWRQVLAGPLWEHLPKTTISRAYSLLRLLLQQDPERRPSAITALKHPYFTDINVALNSALVTKGIQPSLAGNLRAFQHHSSQKAALIVLMAHLSDDVSEEINQIADLFMVLDRDRDGDLSRTEMAAGLRECGVSPASVHNILRAVDLNGSGRVQYTEFVAACFTFGAAHLQLLNAAFCKSDVHNNGALSLEEFKQMLAGPKKASELPVERTKMMYDRIAGGKKITFKDIVRYLHTD
ncbi:MAG: hypothetical protein KVP17_002879 [Porospora cf. gigantea B]|uniref:uncharacterized protein n=1 Tax=Porospora cf. gigantea B TaxID=2853592 RepID=UPI003571ADFF|nr:MAG: hypothetical protein KVP17_002879 [Porospora cf. gigantea B]